MQRHFDTIWTFLRLIVGTESGHLSLTVVHLYRRGKQKAQELNGMLSFPLAGMKNELQAP